MKHSKRLLATLICLFFCAVVDAQRSKPRTGSSVDVSSSWNRIAVKSVIPYPVEIEHEDQARAVSKEAAITQAHNALLTHILSLKTKSGRLLSVAQVPSLDLQEALRLMVKNAPIRKTQFNERVCTVWIQLNKKDLKRILREN